jgi:hypothetical protein
VTTVQENLSSEELEEAERVMEAWNKEGLPREMKLK